MTIRMAQYGTGHGHASGKWRAMVKNADVELAGIYEPDPAARKGDAYDGARWFASAEEMLGDASIEAIAIEGRNDQGLAMAEEAIGAGKHLWFDKPAGDDWPAYQRFIGQVQAQGKHLQMGYMLRYHDAFIRAADLARGGELGDVFQVRAHMSTNITVAARRVISRHVGGILYDLGGHMLDQVVWLLGRPDRVSAFTRNDATPEVPAFSDNTLGVFEFSKAMATVDIAAMEPRPMARRFEIYGTKGSAILVEPFEPGGTIRLTMEGEGEQLVTTGNPDRQELYERELAAFIATVRGEQSPVRSIEHEILVQETLLRATGGIPGN